jgi:hypothetical protein
MLIERLDPYTGKLNTLNISVQQSDYEDYLFARKSAEQAFYYLSQDLIVFIKDGILPEDQSDSYDIFL